MDYFYKRNHQAQVQRERRAPIRVLVIDGSVIALQGVKVLLGASNNILVVATADSEAGAFAALQTCRPDVVVSEVQIGPACGIGLTNAIRESHPDSRIVFFTAYEDPDLLRAAILAGAHGYLLKTASGDALAKGIEAVHAGQAMIDEHLTKQVIQWVRDGVLPAPRATVEDCREEELRLLSHVAEGKTNKEIAQALNLDPRAVATRLQRVYKRLRISRRSEAATSFTKHELGLASELHRPARYESTVNRH